MRLLLVLALLLPELARADFRSRIALAFDGWLTEHHVPRGVLVLLRNGLPVVEVERGVRADPPVELASVGKSLTALCVAALVAQGRLSYDARLETYLGPDAPEATLGDLLTHSAGLLQDSTQTLMSGWSNDPAPRHDAVTALVLQRGAGVPGEYHYSNEDYALLGTIIAQAADRPYRAVCHDAVIDPMGLTTARPSPVTGAFAPWGGWAMSAHDAARLQWLGFGKGARLGGDPLAFPHIEEGYGAFYGMGMVFRPFRDAFNFWHFGALCFGNGPQIGTYTVSWMYEYTLLVYYEACVPFRTMAALDKAMTAAVYNQGATE
ncbi:MAG: serine hydrolase domain-containing protein [Pseudomonadota bacterium]